MGIKLMTTQWTEAPAHGTSTLGELLEYLNESDLFMTIQGRGYARISELKTMVGLMLANQEDKLKITKK